MSEDQPVSHRYRIGSTEVTGRFVAPIVDGQPRPAIVVDGVGRMVIDASQDVFDICEADPVPVWTDGHVTVVTIDGPFHLFASDADGPRAPEQFAHLTLPVHQLVDKELSEGLPHPKWNQPGGLP